MAETIRVTKSGVEVKQNLIVVGGSKRGTVYTRESGVNEGISMSGTLNDRLNDYNYYTA
jgi:hypothetical protein